MKAIPTILVVDDSPDDLLMTRMALTGLDPPPVVLTARDGAEALDMLSPSASPLPRLDAQPHVILLDLKMPRVDGFEVLGQLRADPRLRPIPVIMFTSSREDRDVMRCYELGANAYVVKPVDFQAFLGAVKVIVSFWGSLNEVPSPKPAGASVKGQLAGAA